MEIKSNQVIMKILLCLFSLFILSCATFGSKNNALCVHETKIEMVGKDGKNRMAQRYKIQFQCKLKDDKKK